jgi:hypothetical protein
MRLDRAEQHIDRLPIDERGLPRLMLKLKSACIVRLVNNFFRHCTKNRADLKFIVATLVQIFSPFSFLPGKIALPPSWYEGFKGTAKKDP